MNRFSSAALFGALLAVASPAAAQQKTNYTGYIMCQILSTTGHFLQAPVTIVIEGEKVIFTRPIFNAPGNFVVGNEIALGAISPKGEIQIESHYNASESSFVGKYAGDLRDEAGVLRGAQEWRTSKGQETRQCAIAFIQHK